MKGMNQPLPTYLIRLHQFLISRRVVPKKPMLDRHSSLSLFVEHHLERVGSFHHPIHLETVDQGCLFSTRLQ